MDLRSAVEPGWEHQLELLGALVRSPSLMGSERDAQELVAAELADIGLSPQMWDVGAPGPGSLHGDGVAKGRARRAGPIRPTTPS